MAEHLTDYVAINDRVRLIKPLTWGGTRRDGSFVSGPAVIGATGVVTDVMYEGHYPVRLYVEWDFNGEINGCDVSCIEIIQIDLPPSLDRAAVEAWLNT